MSYFTTERLLTYPPFEALLIAVNETLGTRLNPYNAEVVDIATVDGTPQFADVTLKANQTVDSLYSGQGPVRLKRLDLSDFFGGSYTIVYDGKVSSLDIARIITDGTGIQFSEDDFVKAVITPSSNKLVASDTSLRWFGELTIIEG